MRCRRSAPARTVATLLAGLPAFPASGQEGLRVSGVLSQVLRIDDGGLRGGAERGDPVYSSTTNLGVRFSIATRTTQLALSPGVSAFIGNTRDFELSDLLPTFNGQLSTRGPTTTLSVTGLLTPRLVSDAQFDDTGRADQDVVQIDAALRLGLAQQLSRVSSLNASVGARARTFTESTESLRRNQAIDATAGVRTRLTPSTSATWSGTARYFDTEGRSDGYSLTTRVGASYAATRDLSLNAAVGPSLLRRRETGGTRDDYGVDFDVSATYRAARDTTLTFRAAQAFDQRSDGSFENRVNVSASASHRINTFSSISFGLSAASQLPVFVDEFDDRRTFTLSTNYQYQLTQAWSVNAGYQLRGRSESSDFDTANVVTLRLSRALSILP